MKKTLSLILAAFFCTTVAVQAADSLYRSKAWKFSLKPPSSDTKPTRSVQLVNFFLPPSNGFAPNINVQVQPYTESIANYVSLSKAQFNKLKFTIVKITTDGKKSTAIFEYKAFLSGRHLHFYARAVKRGNYVLLMTAAALESQWPGVKDKLKSSIDSYRQE